MPRRDRKIDYATSTVQTGGRVTIAARYRDKLKIDVGDSVAMVYDERFDGLILTPVDLKGRGR
jgi:bifunctional DNA-binding transcriptional regulator/antitoxin component of YhaV-PrlF toxin-antitoxin module